ncbi:MAG: M28 family peptidase [Saprospiraceae bacterium]|nr:M28 family peptidase [Saprospiraceae bacterium]
MRISVFLFLFLIVLNTGCKDDKKSDSKDVSTDTPKQKAVVPPISADSVYFFVEKQLSFGTRVPGSEGHKKMKDWLVATCKSYGLEVEVQEFKASFLGKKDVPSYNIIASLNPDHKKRVILAAHWDTRLIAEKDPDPSRQKDPIMGADDGGSGVAALLEIMRVMSSKPIDLGVDFIFFDAEDQGEDGGNWCIGSQYWSKNPHQKGYTAEWGILLDLVGAKGATFHKEEISRYFAGKYVDKVWDLAHKMGYGKYFIKQNVGQIQDDHYFVNTIAKIPMLDIIYTTPAGMFGSYHHTHKDDIGIIDKDVLKAVTQVTTATIYKYSDGSL